MKLIAAAISLSMVSAFGGMGRLPPAYLSVEGHEVNIHYLEDLNTKI